LKTAEHKIYATNSALEIVSMLRPPTEYMYTGKDISTLTNCARNIVALYATMSDAPYHVLAAHLAAIGAVRQWHERALRVSSQYISANDIRAACGLAPLQ